LGLVKVVTRGDVDVGGVAGAQPVKIAFGSITGAGCTITDLLSTKLI
jgi:hypothetical protein